MIQKPFPTLPPVTQALVTPLTSSPTRNTLERYRVTVQVQAQEKNQETPESPNSKASKDFKFHNPHTMTTPDLEKGLAAARVDWHRNLPTDYRVALGNWILEVEGILSVIAGLE